MATPPEIEAQILRYYHAERWRVGTIAAQLHVHRDTVARVLAQAGLPAVPGVLHRPSAIEPYLPFIGQTLKQFPSLTAARLYAMVRERGYGGRPDHFRHLIARHRPRRAAEAYLRLRTLPGEQAQVDWAHFGHLQIGRARRPLMGFVMVLSWSRQIFLRFFLDARMESFLRGHVAAFEAWGGVARVALYDNLKSAVLERRGDAIRFHPTLLALAGHYRYEPRPVAVARGNEKGRVERSIRYIRDAFFAARRFTDLDDLNAQAAAWCMADAAERACPEDATMRVGQAFERERAHLLALPAAAFACEEIRAVSVAKTPYVRFDLNDYSVPATEVQRTLSVVACERQVRILDAQRVVAIHARSWDRGAVVEVKQHVQDLVDSKRAARAHRDTDRVVSAAPACGDLLRQAAERGEPLARMGRALGELLDQYGPAELQHAALDATRRGVPHVSAVRLALERRRLLRHDPPPVGVPLPEHIRQRDVAVRHPSLAVYDHLIKPDDAQS